MAEILSVTHQDKLPTTVGTSSTGARGEKLAAEFIQRNGFRIVMANFRVPVGRNSRGVSVTGEIDLIALDGDTLCFIEVKTRRSRDFADPITAVDTKKQRQITRTARVYQRLFGVNNVNYRFDVVTVLLEKDSEPEIEVTKNYWTESKFRKRKWNDDIIY
jgi:putative endonuclease